MAVLLKAKPSIEDDDASLGEETTVRMTTDSGALVVESVENDDYTLWLWRPPSKRRETAVDSLSRILERPAGLIEAIIDRAPALIALDVSHWEMRAAVAITVACGGSVLVSHTDED